MSGRTLVSSGSYLEPVIGFSRAVRVGNHIAVGGTAPIQPEGAPSLKGDMYGQTRRCLEIVAKAITDAGGRLEDVTRTRIIVTDIALWKDAARAHADYFGTIRPVTTTMAITAFVDPDWLVEIEADAIIP
jgi:enamine deaminase RidA (YjgF/YER057c/UK114 family)